MLPLHYTTARRRPLVVDENTAMGDLLRDDRTAPILRTMLDRFGGQAEQNGGGAITGEAALQMMDGMPLRSMVSFGGPEAAAALPGLLAALRGAVPPQDERT